MKQIYFHTRALKTHLVDCYMFPPSTGDRQSVPKRPGFRWLYLREGKHLQLELPLLTCTRSWATAACESSVTLYYLSNLVSSSCQAGTVLSGFCDVCLMEDLNSAGSLLECMHPFSSPFCTQTTSVWPFTAR